MEHARARIYVCATDPLREPRTLYRNGGGIGRPWTRQRSGESSRGMPRGHYSIRECRFSAKKKEREKKITFLLFFFRFFRVERDRSNETVWKELFVSSDFDRSLPLSFLSFLSFSFFFPFKNTPTINRVEWIFKIRARFFDTVFFLFSTRARKESAFAFARPEFSKFNNTSASLSDRSQPRCMVVAFRKILFRSRYHQPRRVSSFHDALLLGT